MIIEETIDEYVIDTELVPDDSKPDYQDLDLEPEAVVIKLDFSDED